MKLFINSISEVRAVVSFTGDLEYDTLVPALGSAQEFLVRYVGYALLEELSADNLTENQAALLPYICRPVANLALLKFANASNTRITDLGLLRTKTGDSNDSFEWQVERTVNALKSEAFEAIEALLRYLGTKLVQFPSYADSSAYKAEKGKLIQSAQIFSQYYDIGESRLILQTLQASMRTAEISIRRIVGSALLTTLLGTGLTDAQNEQLDAARRALVYLTIARALREKLVSISDTGVQVCGISNFGTINFKNPASDKQLETSIRYFDEQAAIFSADLASLVAPPPSTPSTGVPVSPILNNKIVSL